MTCTNGEKKFNEIFLDEIEIPSVDFSLDNPEFKLKVTSSKLFSDKGLDVFGELSGPATIDLLNNLSIQVLE